MIVITFRAICRDHDLDRTLHLKGAATLRQIDKGYEAMDRDMQKLGCDDYNITYSVSHVMKGQELPA